MKTKTLENLNPGSRLRMQTSTLLAVVMVGLTLLRPHAAVAQYTIDLASQSSTTPSTIAVDAGKSFEVRIINRLPYSGSYVLTVAHRVKSISAFSSTGFTLNTAKKVDTTGNSKKIAVAAAPDTSSCQALRTAIENVEKATEESTIAQLLPKLRSVMELHHCSVIEAEAQATIDATTQYVDSSTLQKGEELVVTITSGKKTWSTVYTTGDRGVWSVTYGFAIPWFLWNKDSLYVTRTVLGKNVVTASSGQDNAQVLPAIFVSWIPYSSELSDWSFGFGSGLSFDKSKPVLQLGLSITYNQNINILVGALGEFTKVLLPQYHSGDTLGESLTTDQLHQDVFKVAPAIGISYRFDSNPFK